MKIIILVPDGIGIRNYLYSDVFKYLQPHEVILLHRLPVSVLEEIKELHGNCFSDINLPVLTETKRLIIVRRICNYARLYQHARIAKNPSISANWLLFSVAKGKFKLNHLLAQLIGKIIVNIPGGLQKLENYLATRGLKAPLGLWGKKTFIELKPDLVFCTHQRSIDASYLMTMASHLAIKTTTVIFSWDNLPKSRMTFRAKQYFVWSEWMKKDLLRYYPEIEEHQAIVTGTPQFECYVKQEMVWSEDVFRTKLGLPPNRPLVCFSGNEPTFPSDYLYLQDLLVQIKDGSQTDALPFILVRPSPADHTDRFENIVAGFEGHAKVCRPDWQLSGERSWEAYYPKVADVTLLTNIIHHCKAVINVGSTMGIDFAHANKPALYIKYNHPDCPKLNLIYGYEQEHFKTLRNKNAVAWIHRKDQFLSLVLQAVNFPDSIATDRLAWKTLIMDDIYNASQNIALALTR